MSPLVESIKILNGRVYNINRHQHRFNEARFYFFGIKRTICLKSLIRVPADFQHALVKCRIVYGKDIQHISFENYNIRPVSSLKLVYEDSIYYDFKSTHRDQLNDLFSKRQHADDVIIVRQGLLTDSSICNIALYDGHSWYTPAKPLLKGTQRDRLLDLGRIKPKHIEAAKLQQYKKIRLFNALIGFGKIEVKTDYVI